MPPGYANHLYYGDNLTILREHSTDASIDLIYLNPPFAAREPTTCYSVFLWVQKAFAASAA